MKARTSVNGAAYCQTARQGANDREQRQGFPPVVCPLLSLILYFSTLTAQAQTRKVAPVLRPFEQTRTIVVFVLGRAHCLRSRLNLAVHYHALDISLSRQGQHIRCERDHLRFGRDIPGVQLALCHELSRMLLLLSRSKVSGIVSRQRTCYGELLSPSRIPRPGVSRVTCGEGSRKALEGQCCAPRIHHARRSGRTPARGFSIHRSHWPGCCSMRQH